MLTFIFAVTLHVNFTPSAGPIVPDGYRLEWGVVSGSHPNVVPLTSLSDNPDGSKSSTVDIAADVNNPVYVVLHSYKGTLRSDKSNEVVLGKPGAPVLLTVEPSE